MNRDALLNLARVVRDAPEDQFHMQAVVARAPCGTVRCALGWAIIDPWFGENTRLNELFPLDYDHSSMYYFSDNLTLEAVFGIGYEDASNLFGANLQQHQHGHLVTKEEVLWNIAELLAGRSALPYRAVGMGDRCALFSNC